MASLSLRSVGAIEKKISFLPPSFSSVVTYMELTTGLYLVAFANVAKNMCILQLLGDGFTAAADVEPSCLPPPEGLTKSEKSFDPFCVPSQAPKVIEILDEEGVITAIELVRDYRRVEKGSKELFLCGGRKLPKALYVHLFIGTSNGTVFVCNALRGTIMALAQFHYYGNFDHSRLEHAQETEDGFVSLADEMVLKFAACCAGPDARLNANIAQSVSSLPATDVLHAVCVVHSGGRVIVLGRDALDVFISVAEQRLDGSRPYLMLQWSPESTISSYPSAGPAANFASFVQSVFILTEMENYSAVEKQTQPLTLDDGVKRKIYDAAFYFGNIGDTTAVLRSGQHATESLLLCGAMPALSVYTFEDTQAKFSARQTVKAVFSLLGGMARKMWWRSSSANDDVAVERPKVLDKKMQLAKDVFLEADLTFNTVQIDPTFQWAACYSEGAGRIYVYDLMTGAVWRVVKGCRSAECQWHVTNVGGKRMLLLVVHLILRNAVEFYSLRLGRRLAARYVPKGSALIRPESASSVLFLTPSGEILRINIELGENKGECASVISAAMPFFSPTDGSSVAAVAQEKGHKIMPRDVLLAALRLPLPADATDEELLTKYYSQIEEVKTAIKNNFHPEIFADCCFPINAVAKKDDVPSDITAAQCLNYIELRLACLKSYSRARLLLLLRPDDKIEQHYEKPDGDEALFDDVSEELHPSLAQALRLVSEKLLADGMADDAGRVEDVLPSLRRLLLMRKCDCANALGSPCLEISPIPLDAFLGFFFYGGYKLVFLRDAVQSYHESSADKTAVGDVWAEIGAVFYAGDGRGLWCIKQQLEVFSTLGFQPVDVVLISLSWLCHSFACSCTHVSQRDFISSLEFLLKTCNDAAFLSAVESVSWLASRSFNTCERAELCIALLIVCMGVRQRVKPFGQTSHKRYLRLLQQLLVLRAIVHRWNDFIQEDSALCFRSSTSQALCLKKLFVCEGGDTLSAFCFKFFPSSVAAVFCENIICYNDLKNAMGGLDLVEVLKLLFFMENNLDWTLEEKPPDDDGTPWYKDGVWSHEKFSCIILKPFLALVIALTPNSSEQEVCCSAASAAATTTTPQQLAGLSVLLSTGLELLQWMLKPLREEPLVFMQKNIAPDANLFEGDDDVLTRNHKKYPRGSRSTRDYFSSSHKLLLLTQQICVQFIGTAECFDCDRIVNAVSQFLSHDNALLFPFIPAKIRLQLQDLTAVLCANPNALLQRIQEARFFLETVMFFAFKERTSVCSRLLRSVSQPPVSQSPPPPPQPSSSSSSSLLLPSSFTAASFPIVWDLLFEPRKTLLHLLPDSEFSRTFNKDEVEARMIMRSTFLKEFAFAANMSCPIKVCADYVKGLSSALGISEIVCDMPQLVLFDLVARGLSSNVELNRILNLVKSRHLAARIAAEDFRIIVASCFKYYNDLKRGIPKGNRLELQGIALKIQSMNSTMCEDCRAWIHGDLEKKSYDGVRTDEVPPVLALPLDYRLVACPGWYTQQDLSAVEEKVRERLRQPRNAEALQDFKALLLTLSRVAAEGEQVLSDAVRHFAARLPFVAVSLGDLF